VPTSAGRYNPLYYALVGWPLKFAPDWTGLVLARLLSAAWSALLVACAFVVLIRWSRFGLMIGALVLSASPMLAHLAGAVNPNGIEIAAGIAFFSAGIPLLLGPRRGNTKPLWWLLGTSGVVLGTVRSLGPVWLALGLALLLTPTSRRAVARLWADRLARGWLLALGAALVLSVAWILIMGTGQIAPAAKPGHLSLIHATYQYLDNWTTYLYGMVGVAGWFDIRLSVPFYWAYVGAAATLVVLGLIAGGWANRWRFFLVLVGGLIIPGVLQVSEVNQVGFIIGGRYMLPLVVAMPLLGAFITERRVVTDRQARSLTKLCCLIAMPTQLALLLWAMMRWQKGLNGLNLNPLTGQWHPPSGSALPVLLMLAGIAVVWWISIRSVHESLTYADLDPASPDSRAVTPGRSWSLVEADPSIDAASTNGSVVSSTGGSARSPAHGDGQL
jgi:hypothetical protein